MYIFCKTTCSSSNQGLYQVVVSCLRGWLTGNFKLCLTRLPETKLNFSRKNCAMKIYFILSALIYPLYSGIIPWPWEIRKNYIEKISKFPHFHKNSRNNKNTGRHLNYPIFHIYGRKEVSLTENRHTHR